MENVKEFVSYMGMFGVPTIFVMVTWCVKRILNFTTQMKILMESQQSQMKRDLLVDYKELVKFYQIHGYIEDDDLEIWEDNYQKYHALGKNGVMDNKRAHLLSLPTVPPVVN